MPLHSATRDSLYMIIGHMTFWVHANAALYAAVCDVATASMRPFWQQPPFGTATQSPSTAHAW